ncbi:hypothetical protein OBV_13320 [Oscillibacter valericigenes Sjm18-20]|nr:hypothetical protein OBV_13320 [Oscillibacter valericigenes Sjm18-20]
MIRHRVKQVQSKVPAQGNVYLDALLNLPLRREYTYPISGYLTSIFGSMGGQSCRYLYSFPDSS